MAKMNKIYATNKSEMINVLSAIDIKVPLRSEGRTNDHCEKWSICYWLSTYPNFTYPILLIHRDRPDFYIKFGEQEVGIEHTEAIPSDYAHADAIYEKKDDDNAVLDMSLFRWGQKKKNREVSEIVSRTKLTGPGWEGDSPEIEWAEAMADIINNKTTKLRKNEFDKFSANYLLIYDNLPRPNIDFSKSISQLMASLNAYWGSGIIFDIIFVQTDDLLMSFDSSTYKKFKNNKIW